MYLWRVVPIEWLTGNNFRSPTIQSTTPSKRLTYVFAALAFAAAENIGSVEYRIRQSLFEP